VPRNVEIKARVGDIEALRRRAAELSDTPVQVLHQTDTFYIVPHGRLKLRVRGPDACELIQYARPDATGAKASEYHLVRSDDPRGFERVLSASLDMRGVVIKTRFLYLVGQTRIHVDDVKDLGAFMELEVMLGEGQTVEEGTRVAEDLMAVLGMREEDLVSGAYIDLLEEETPRCS